MVIAVILKTPIPQEAFQNHKDQGWWRSHTFYVLNICIVDENGTAIRFA
jgi:hypothetical protein